MRKLAGDFLARARIAASSGSPTTVSFATTRTFVSPVLSGEVDDDVLDGNVDRRLDAADDVAPQPAGPRLGVRRDDHLVRRRHELLERVADDVDGVGVDDEAVGGDAVRAQQVERAVEPAPRGGAGACPRRRRSRDAAG